MQELNAETMTKMVLASPVNNALELLTEHEIASVMAGVQSEDGSNAGVVVLINRSQFEPGYAELLAKINKLLSEAQHVRTLN